MRDEVPQMNASMVEVSFMHDQNLLAEVWHLVRPGQRFLLSDVKSNIPASHLTQSA